MPGNVLRRAPGKEARARKTGAIHRFGVRASLLLSFKNGMVNMVA